ncbi:ATP-binding protein [Streptomyces mirabilis]|uniref:ATP-binding protein n=1 Tax=Streptomyces mirabilis TaxID=68239 RepID=UPI003804DF1F
MGAKTDRFRAELNAAHQAAGKPTLERLVRLGLEQRPPIKISDSAISGWTTGPAVPGPAQRRYFLVLTAFLQNEAKRRNASYTPRSQAWWQELLSEAQRERNSGRGGRPRTSADTPAQGPMTLPAAPSGFTGRSAALAEVLGQLEPGRQGGDESATIVVSAVAGMAGIGKTALALHTAHQARARGWFPGGTLFADMRGYSTDASADPATVADRFLRAFGVSAKDIPDTAEGKLDAWRNLLDQMAQQRRPVLVVLDNVRTAAQTALLLPAAPHRALITSRHSLSALPVHCVGLGPLPPDEAVELLDQSLRAGTTGDGRVQAQPDAAHRLAHLCGYLPLALRITAALLRDEPDRSLAEQVSDLEDARVRLDALDYPDTGPDGGPLAIRAAFDLSYRHLTAPQARAFRLLARAPGTDLSADAVSYMLGLHHSIARRLLVDLARAHLIDATGDQHWSMHDLLRLYAGEHAAASAVEDQQAEAMERLITLYAGLTQQAVGHLKRSDASVSPENRTRALDWLERERTNLVTAVTAGPSLGQPTATLFLADALNDFFSQQHYYEDWVTTITVALSLVVATGDRQREAIGLTTLGAALSGQRKFTEAIDACFQSQAIARELGDRRQEAGAWTTIGNAYRELHQLPQSEEACRKAATGFREVDDPVSEAGALVNLGGTLAAMRGRAPDAVQVLREALGLYEAAGDTHGMASTLINLSGALCETGNSGDAVELCKTAVAILKVNDPHAAAVALINLAVALKPDEQYQEAIDACQQALDLLRTTRSPHLKAQALARLGSSLTYAGRYPEAIEALSGAISGFRESGGLHHLAESLNNLSALLFGTRHPDEAVEPLTQAAAIHRQLGDVHREARTLMLLARAHHGLQQFEETFEALIRAAALFHEAEDHSQEGQARIDQALILSDLWLDHHELVTPAAGEDSLLITPLPPGDDGLPVLAISLALPAAATEEHRTETATGLAHYLDRLGFNPLTHGIEQLTVSDQWIALISPVQNTADGPDQWLLTIVDPLGTILFLRPLTIPAAWCVQAIDRALCLLIYDPASPTTSSNEQQQASATPHDNGRLLAAVIPLRAYDPTAVAPEEPGTSDPTHTETEGSPHPR